MKLNEEMHLDYSDCIIAIQHNIRRVNKLLLKKEYERAREISKRIAVDATSLSIYCRDLLEQIKEKE